MTVILGGVSIGRKTYRNAAGVRAEGSAVGGVGKAK